METEEKILRQLAPLGCLREMNEYGNMHFLVRHGVVGSKVVVRVARLPEVNKTAC